MTPIDPRRSLPPKLLHALDQLSGRASEVAPLLETHRRELIESGMPDADAWALVRDLELRLLGRLLTEAEYRISELP